MKINIYKTLCIRKKKSTGYEIKGFPHPMDMDSDLGVTGNSSQKFSLFKKVIYKPDKHFVKIKVRTGLRGELSLLYNQCFKALVTTKMSGTLLCYEASKNIISCSMTVNF